MPQAHQLGRYQLLDRIAFGGMAEIYRAKTFDGEGRARLVAVKRVLQHLTTDDDFIRMLVDEAKITAVLDHEAIARVYEFSQAGDEYFIAMEYVDGKDVRSILEKHRQTRTPIPIEHAVWIAAHVAEGLHAAHTQTDADGKPMQIVHRDVSPSNVLCAYQGDVKLCDFGIAKATLTRVQTRTGVIKGKVKYMSPEQAMGRKLDGRSDLFSLGTVLYEMLTLEAPFIAQTEVELIFAVRDARKRDAREIVPTLPEPLNAILNRTMGRQRSDRFQNGRELARELRGFLDKHSPGYRRGNFGRFMRTIFKDEIEKELRQLEGWVIDAGSDASKVGVNLIADVLPDNAPFKGFTAAASSHSLDSSDLIPASAGDMPAQKTSIYHGKPSPPPRGDLHAEPTHILERSAVNRGRRGDLHQRETMMLEGRAADDLRAQLRASLSKPLDPKLHEHETRLFDDAPPAPAETPSSATALPAQSTRILGHGEKLASIPAPPPPPPKPLHSKPRIPRDTKPDSGPRRFDDGDDGEITNPKPPSDFAAEMEDSANPTNPRAHEPKAPQKKPAKR